MPFYDCEGKNMPGNRTSIRLKKYDYTQQGAYYVTMCVNDRKNIRGCIDEGRGNRAPTLSQIIAYFKYGSTKQINQLRNTPGVRLWQRNFYEHIIRNEYDLTRIREYIINNPANWEKDEYYA